MPDFQLSVRSADALPYLLLAPESAAVALPVVLVLHGLGSTKEKTLPTMYAFAQAGFRVIALDARLHGERTSADQRELMMSTDYFGTMHEIIAGTAHDVSLLLDILGLSEAGIHGVSLGGYITFSALVNDRRLSVASVAMGSPDWLGPLKAMGIDTSQPVFAGIAAANPLDRAAATYPPRPLLMLHGALDEVVPISGVRTLEERLRPLYGHDVERLRLTIYPDLGHTYTEEMLRESIAWTSQFLQ